MFKKKGSPEKFVKIKGDEYVKVVNEDIEESRKKKILKMVIPKKTHKSKKIR